MALAKRLFLILITLLFLPLSLQAGEFELDTGIVGQIRENVRNQTESPLNGYLGLAIDKPKWHIAAETNMRIFRDFNRKWDDYDLYQAVLHVYPNDIVSLDFGRQFVNQGFTVDTIDGLSLGIVPTKYVNLTLYSGIPRSVEIGDFNKNDGLLSGLTVGLQNVPQTNVQLHVAWRKNNIRVNNLRENDEVLAGINLSYLWENPVELMLYGLFEYNVIGKVIDTGTFGLDVYPTSRIALNLEFNYYNVDRNYNRPSILALITQGHTIMGRMASTVTLVEDYLDFVTNFSFQRLEIQRGTYRNGYLLEVDFPISVDDIGLSLIPGYYFTKSFGGTLHGARLVVHEQFTKEFYADVGFDFSTYNKITNDNDNAYAINAWAGYEIIEGLNFAMGAEYNRNNLFNHDVRGSVRIDYHYGTKI